MIVGVSMVKDEEDIAATTVGHLFAEGIDRVLVLDNNSTDKTRAILERFDEVKVIDDPEVGYYQSAKMSELAEDARCLGASWIVPFDFDEIWYAHKGTVADVLKRTVANVVWARTYEHPPHEGDGLSPYRALHAKPHRKVAFRAIREAVIAQGNHDVSIAGPREGGLEIREFQYRTFEQFVRKVRNGKAAYDATDLPLGEGAHWRTYGAMTDDDLAFEWQAMTNRGDIVFDPAPIRC